jgi:hypothetical protein
LIAICFLNSYFESRHEDRVAALAQELFPEAFITTSASIFPQFREFERFTTVCINAFVGPKVTTEKPGFCNDGLGLSSNRQAVGPGVRGGDQHALMAQN